MKSMLMHIHSRLHRPPHFYLVILGGSLFAAHIFCVAREWGLLDAEWGVWRAFVAFGDVGGVRVVSWVLCMGVAAVFCACYDRLCVVLAVVWACRWVWQRVAVPAVVGLLRGGRAAWGVGAVVGVLAVWWCLWWTVGGNVLGWWAIVLGRGVVSYGVWMALGVLLCGVGLAQAAVVVGAILFGTPWTLQGLCVLVSVAVWWCGSSS